MKKKVQLRKRAPLVVIDGADGSGKGTQVDLLVTELRRRGQKVTVFDFPRYDTFFGSLVGQALRGKLGDFKGLDPHLASLPFTLDRLASKHEIEEALASSDIVICNRYTPSNIAYQAAKLRGWKKAEFIAFMEKAEYEVLGLPRPDLVLYLYVKPEVSFELVAHKSGRKYLGKVKGERDQHEADQEYQRAVVKQYLALAKANPRIWRVVNCMNGNVIKSRVEIHESIIWTVPQLFLP